MALNWYWDGDEEGDDAGGDDACLPLADGEGGEAVAPGDAEHGGDDDGARPYTSCTLSGKRN